MSDGKFLRRAGDIVLRAHGNEHRHIDLRPMSSTDRRSREVEMQAASACRSLLVWSAKARNMRPRSWVTRRWRAGKKRSAIGSQSPTPVTMPMPRPPRTSEADAMRIGERQEGGNARAHGIAHDVGLGDAEMVEQRDRVVGHAGRMVGRRIMGLVARAMAAIVERDHPVAGITKRLQPTRINPVDVGAGGKAVDQQAPDRPAGRPRRSRRSSARHG